MTTSALSLVRFPMLTRRVLNAYEKPAILARMASDDILSRPENGRVSRASRGPNSFPKTVIALEKVVAFLVEANGATQGQILFSSSIDPNSLGLLIPVLTRKRRGSILQHRRSVSWG